MTEVRYIRNRRPNALNLRVGGRHTAESVGQANAVGVLDLRLGRRYTRTDSAALSEGDFKDGQVQNALRRGHIEEISEEAFMELAARPDQDDSYRDPSEPQTKRRLERDPTILEMPGGTNQETIIPEFQPEGQRYHRDVPSEHGTKKQPIAREDREKVRRIMTPGLEFVEEPKATEKELAKKRKAAPRRKKK